MQKKPLFGRRSFIISLGSGAGAVIAGYWILRDGEPARHAPDKGGPGDSMPALRDDIRYGMEGRNVTLTRPSGPVFGVNEVGARIIRLLDGRRSLVKVTAKLAESTGLREGEVLQAKVAEFVAYLAMLQFTTRPSYAYITETYQPVRPS